LFVAGCLILTIRNGGLKQPPDGPAHLALAKLLSSSKGDCTSFFYPLFVVFEFLKKRLSKLIQITQKAGCYDLGMNGLCSNSLLFLYNLMKGVPLEDIRFETLDFCVKV